ncbi:MAG: hypothetical protein NW203_07445 [Hyphomonadaceae bacterium]|nr:hypothetical protein [Hyphomonadaceae bacterium]
MVDQDGGETPWRRKLQRMRTRPALKRDDIDAAARTLKLLAAEDIEAAAHNPDHSAVARELAARGLAARGAALQPWRLRVPGFIGARDLAGGDHVFFGAGRTLRRGAGAITFAALALVFVIAFIEVARGAPRSAPMPDYAMIPSGAFGGFAIVWLIATILRRRPARLLLLRKFNVRRIGEDLARVISNELRPYGHIVSLSDRHIRRARFEWLGSLVMSLNNPAMAVWLVVTAPVRIVWRLFDRSRMGPALVANARDYRNLARRLRDRAGLNLQTALTSKEAFLVRTSDAWWRMTVQLLFESCDAIVVDLTLVAAGTAWELDRIREDRAVGRCVFIAHQGAEDAAAAALRDWGFAKTCHVYHDGGAMRDRAAFRADLLDAMRATIDVANAA